MLTIENWTLYGIDEGSWEESVDNAGDDWQKWCKLACLRRIGLVADIMYFNFYVLLIYEQNNIPFRMSNSCMIPPLFVQNTCKAIHWLHLSKLAAVSSHQWEQWLCTGLMGNAKVEYYLRIQCYCLQWLNVTHMDENSFWDVYLYRLYFIMLYWDPDYTNKQETKQE